MLACVQTSPGSLFQTVCLLYHAVPANCASHVRRQGQNIPFTKTALAMAGAHKPGAFTCHLFV